MAKTFFIRCRSALLAGAVLVTALVSGLTASAEPAAGWASTAAETKVFVAPRDDGRTVGVYVRPAKKGAVAGIIVRLTLSGFSDKKLALRVDDVPELYGFKQMANKRKNPTILVNRSNMFDVGDVEHDVRTGIASLIEGGQAARAALETRYDAVSAACQAGGDLAQRFVNANSQTVQWVASGSRGQVVRAIHAALISASK